MRLPRRKDSTGLGELAERGGAISFGDCSEAGGLVLEL